MRGARRACTAALACLGLVLAPACNTERKPAAPAARQATAAPTAPAVILRIGDRKIDTAEFARVLGEPPQRREHRSEHERRSEFLEELERTELLATRAQQHGYFSRPEVVAARKNAIVQHMLDDLFGEHGSARTPVTDADVKAYYEAHLLDYTSPEQVRAGQILVRTQKQALALIAQLQEHPEQRTHFGELALQHSIDESTKKRGGDLGAFALEPPPALDARTAASLRPRYIPVSVRQAVFTLEQPGTVYPTPVHSELGFHVLLLVWRRPSSRYQLSQVQYMLHQKLATERHEADLDSFIKQLESYAHVEQHPQKLALVRVAP